MNHYTYMLVDPISEMKYIGVRSCSCPIDEDSYKGSSSVMTLEEKNRCIKLILGVFNTRVEANNYEVELHTKLNVVANKSYWNKVNADAPPVWVGGYRKLPKISIAKTGIPLSDTHIESLKVAQQKRWSEGRGPQFKYGEEHPARKFKGVYVFKHLDGREFTGTNLEFKKFLKIRYIQNANKIIVGEHFQYKGWYVVSNISSGCTTTDSKYVNCYTWSNNTETFVGTGYQLSIYKNIPLGNINKVIRGERTITQGWGIIQTEYHQTV